MSKTHVIMCKLESVPLDHHLHGCTALGKGMCQMHLQFYDEWHRNLTTKAIAGTTENYLIFDMLIG